MPLRTVPLGYGFLNRLERLVFESDAIVNVRWSTPEYPRVPKSTQEYTRVPKSTQEYPRASQSTPSRLQYPAVRLVVESDSIGNVR